MKLRLIAAVLALSLCGLLACSSRSTTQSQNGTGTVYLVTQGNTAVSTYTVSLSNGALSSVGATLSTGNSPVALAITPSLNALFIANSGSNNISSYTLSGNAGLTAGSSTATGGTIPMGLAVDPAGKFLFVANEASSNISVFSINGAALSKVAGSPFTTIPGGSTTPTDPVAVAVSPSGKWLYVANQSANNISVFSIASSGALAPVVALPNSAGLGPTGLAIPASGAFLYVANAGSNNVSAFSICDKVVTSCANPNAPDGTLHEVSGSPFPAGQTPVAIAIDPSFGFLYVLDKGSNEVSQYSYATGTGVLTVLSPGTVATGLTPTGFAIIGGATGTNAGNTLTNPQDYMFVANNGASTLSSFALNTTTGQLTTLGLAVTTENNPSAVGAN